MVRTPLEEANLAHGLAMYEAVLFPLDSRRVDDFIAFEQRQRRSFAFAGRDFARDAFDHL